MENENWTRKRESKSESYRIDAITYFFTGSIDQVLAQFEVLCGAILSHTLSGLLNDLPLAAHSGTWDGSAGMETLKPAWVLIKYMDFCDSHIDSIVLLVQATCIVFYSEKCVLWNNLLLNTAKWTMTEKNKETAGRCGSYRGVACK